MFISFQNVFVFKLYLTFLKKTYDNKSNQFKLNELQISAISNDEKLLNKIQSFYTNAVRSVVLLYLLNIHFGDRI